MSSRPLPSDGLHALASLVWSEFKNSPPHTRDAADIVFQRKAIGLEAAMSRNQALLSGRYPHLQVEIQQWNRLRAQVARKTIEGPAQGQSLQQHLEMQKDLERRLERAERELARHVPELQLEEKLQGADRSAVGVSENVAECHVSRRFNPTTKLLN